MSSPTTADPDAHSGTYARQVQVAHLAVLLVSYVLFCYVYCKSETSLCHPPSKTPRRARSSCARSIEQYGLAFPLPGSERPVNLPQAPKEWATMAATPLRCFGGARQIPRPVNARKTNHPSIQAVRAWPIELHSIQRETSNSMILGRSLPSGPFR